MSGTALRYVLGIAVIGCVCACLAPPPPLAPQPSPASQPSSRFLSAQDFTHRVRNLTCDGIAIGSGFPVTARLLITNRHVVAGAQTIQLDGPRGDSFTVAVAGVSTLADLAMVVTTEDLPTVAALAAQDARTSARVHVLGYPLGGELTVTDGSVRDYEPDPLLASAGLVMALDAVAEHGNSGGPVVDDDGSVVGVLYAKDASDHALAIPVSTLRTVLELHDSGSSVGGCG